VKDLSAGNGKKLGATNGKVGESQKGRTSIGWGTGGEGFPNKGNDKLVIGFVGKSESGTTKGT